jgi:integrase
LRAFPADPAVIGLFAAHLAEAGRKISTIKRKLAAIAKAHRDQGRYSPCSMRYSGVSDVIHGIEREKGSRADAKDPLTVEQLRKMVDALPETARGMRDRALLLVGFASGCRRSELAALEVGDIEETEDGLRVLIRRSKTDPSGEGHVIGIAYGSQLATCPVRNLRLWLASSGITGGAVFRGFRGSKMVASGITAQVIADVVKRAAERAGINAAGLSAHSLRSGLATAAAHAGCPERDIMRQTRHRSAAMVRKYIREAELFRNNVSSKLGL